MNTLPYEEQVIGTFLSGYGTKMIDVLNAEDFHYFPKTFKAIKYCVDSQQDINPIDIAKKSEFKLHELLELMTRCFPSTLESNISALKKNTSKWRFEQIMSEKPDGDIDEVIASVIQRLKSISLTTVKTSQTSSDAILDYIRELDDRVNNKGKEMFIDIPKYNHITAGLHKKELTIVGARPSVGKSVFGLQVATALAHKKFKVLFVSMEMAEVQIMGRLVARYSGVNNDKLRLGELDKDDWAKVSLAMDDIVKASFIMETNIRTIGQLRTRIITEQPDVVILDYIGLLRDDSQKYNSRYEEVSAISRKLKLMTLDFNIPIVALAQLRRDAEGKQPTLADLRDSGSLEQDADNVVFLHRLTPKEAENEGYGSLCTCELMVENGITPVSIIVEKQRDGRVGAIRALLDSKELRFKEYGGV